MKFLLHWRKIGLDLDGSKTVFFFCVKIFLKKIEEMQKKMAALQMLRIWKKTLFAQIESKITVAVWKNFQILTPLKPRWRIGT